MPLPLVRLTLAALAMLAPASPAWAEAPLDGFFVAEEACPATVSIRKGDNPGRVETEAGRSYELLAGNREDATHYLIRVPGAQPQRRWVDVECGHRAALAGPAAKSGGKGRARPEYVLAVSWQPGFCETRPEKRECATQTETRFDASHFSLHGLWPQPRSNVYCGVSSRDEANDDAGRWERLPPVDLDARTRAELARVMPGTASHLDRHEWIKHGTCHGGSMQDYFAQSLELMRAVNASAARDLFAESIGGKLTVSRVRAAFDRAFGPGAGARVRLSCVTDPSSGRRLVGELTIGLAGPVGEGRQLADLILAAPPTADAGCPEGIVDAAGLQ